jgi:6-phosphogluconate dehydrogenase
MAMRPMQGSHDIIAHDLSQAAVQEFITEGSTGAVSLQQFVEKLSAPKNVWITLPDVLW